MRRVFADTFFYIALLNRKDTGHQQAVKFAAVETVEIVTTVAILLETGDAMSTPGRRMVLTP